MLQQQHQQPHQQVTQPARGEGGGITVKFHATGDSSPLSWQQHQQHQHHQHHQHHHHYLFDSFWNSRWSMSIRCHLFGLQLPFKATVATHSALHGRMIRFHNLNSYLPDALTLTWHWHWHWHGVIGPNSLTQKFVSAGAGWRSDHQAHSQNFHLVSPDKTQQRKSTNRNKP